MTTTLTAADRDEMLYGVKTIEMLCPFGEHTFKISQKQMDNNQTFTCTVCHKTNQGSYDSTLNGVLIGRTRREVSDVNSVTR